MATIGNTYLTLADLYKQQDGMGQVVSTIIEILKEINPILNDAMALECNDGTRHLTSIRTGLPAVTWRKLYQGVQPSKSTMKQVHDTTGMVEAWSEVDEKLVKLSGNPGQFRLNEAKAFIEAMGQEVASRLFYGNTATDPEQFLGLSPRFGDLSAENGQQIVDAGGTGSDNTSVWMITWGERACSLLYPKGTKAGLDREDYNTETKELSDGSMYRVMRERFTWDVGLTIRDWRYVVRIANIDVSDLAANTVDIYDFFRQAYYKQYNRRANAGRTSIYCNTEVMEALDRQATNPTSTSTANIHLKPMEVEGKEIMSYRGMPIWETDAILNTEARVT